MLPKPFVKWAGGKTRLLSELLARVPTEIRTYAEPFAGGAALFFALAGKRAESNPQRFQRAVLSDRNEELVATYRAIKTNVGQVVALLRGYRYERTMYYATRALDTKGMSDVERAARFIYLNRTCFNGLWRVNASGKFNVPFGRYANPKIVDERTLVAAALALENADITSCDFLKTTKNLGSGDFVYFDPPYVPVSKTADFTNYVPNGFGPSDQERLAQEFGRLAARGVSVMLSNANTPTSRALYADWAVHEVLAARAINSDPRGRGPASEIVVTSWGPPGYHALGGKRVRRPSPSNRKDARC
jgi:DNA adenine methylase